MLIYPDINDVVNIYVNYKEDKKYYGKAKLIEKISEGDTFYEDNEFLSKDTIAYFNQYKNSRNAIVKTFFKNMYKLCTKKSNSYNKMLEVIEQYRKVHKNTAASINNILKKDDKKIISFFQQTKYKWRGTLFRAERWKVLMLSDGYSKEYVTYKYIKVLESFSPKENNFGSGLSELSQRTTYSTVSLYDKYVYEKLEDLEDIEPSDNEIKEIEKNLNLYNGDDNKN